MCTRALCILYFQKNDFQDPIVKKMLQRGTRTNTMAAY